jgi:hypothetical protein
MSLTDLLPGAKRRKPKNRKSLVPKLRDQLGAYSNDESGAMIAFTLITFIGMLVGAGMAIDFLRFEDMRVRMQATLDRSLLAAAALDQSLDAESVVIDYFAKSGISNYTLNVTVDEGINYKTISGTVSVDVDSIFLNMVGIDSMSALASGTAEEKIQHVEVALVLDISGSMGSYSRLTNMQAAAKEFVDTLLSASDPGHVFISIIPYNANVNVGSRLIQEYSVSNEHSSSNCVRFDDEDFVSVSLSPSQSLERLAHFDISTSYGYSPINYPWCQTSDDLGILALSTSKTDLDARIDALVANGNTAADNGMKWAAALLDPGSSSVITNMIASGDMDSALSDRPAAYDDADTIKTIIVLTDGQNTTQYDIQSDRKSGYSNIWLDSSASESETDKYSVYVAAYDEYYYPHNGTWNDEPLGAAVTTETTCGWQRWGRRWYWVCEEETTSTGGDSDAVQLTYPELWGLFSVSYVANYFYDWSSSYYSDYYYSYETIVSGSSSDSRFLNICSKVKNEDVIVFTVGFEAPSAAEATMQSCATSSAHYYDVDGLEISGAFSAIAATLMRLKLVE